MRLRKITKTLRQVGNFDELEDVIFVEFATNGVNITLPLSLPDDWGAMSRAEKIAWGKAEIATHLAETTYQEPGEVVFSQVTEAEAAADEMETDLPDWASWTPGETEQYIIDNVVDLASAKIALRKMARMLAYLRRATLGLF